MSSPITLHIDEPAEAELIIERDTTPKLDFHIYEDEDLTTPVDVADYTFELVLKETLDVATEDAALRLQDADFTKKPGGLDYVIRAPITQAQTNDPTIVLPDGVWMLYWTDGSGHRERLMKGTFRANK